MEQTRVTQLQLGIRIEIITIVWMMIEMAVSIGAGIAAGSVLLIAFGLDSLIELIGGGILLWRLQVEARKGDPERVKQAEHRAAWVIAICLALLCVYTLVSAAYGLASHAKPESSLPGILVSAAAVLVMPYLAVTKRKVATRIASDALAGDAVNSITCAYMAGTVLLGLVANALFGWWWAESIAALLFLVWLVRETIEAFEEAREDSKTEELDHGE
jgi:divalent metal cation (Fe/Co/Zn/Cd) transporter